jgi:hypothetical protein
VVETEGCGGGPGVKWKLKRASSIAYPEYPTEPISRIKRSSSLRGFRNMEPYGASDVCRNVLCVRKIHRLVEGRTGRASLQAMCAFADAHVCVCGLGGGYFIVSWRRKVVPRPGVEVLT